MKLFSNAKQRVLFLSITALGISSVITQLLVMREFMSVFYGNELVIGVILGNWLLLTGLGSYLGRYAERIKHRTELLIYSQLLIAILPLLHLLLIRSMRTRLFLPGEMIGLGEVFASSFLLLAPYCVISGFLLALFVVVYSNKGRSGQIGIVYFLDNIGDIIGGLLFSFLLIYIFSHFHSAYLILFINLFAALVLSIYFKKKFLSILSSALIVVCVLSLVFLDLDSSSLRSMFKGQEVLLHKNSLYGSIVITRSEDQINFFENGLALFSTGNIAANEETVHYALSQLEAPAKVLLISGGVSGTVREVLKHDVERVDYVELDPLVIMLGDEFTANLRFRDEVEANKLRLIISDARRFVKTTTEEYDAIIIDLPDPSTAQLNRFYTLEFFQEARKIMKQDGVLSLSITSSENYMGPEASRLNSAVYNTLKKVFINVIIIPGDRNYFLASDSELSYDVAEKLKARNISTNYVNEYYLSTRLSDERINYLMSSLVKTPVNTDFKPVTYYYQMLFWLKHFSTNYFLIIIIVTALLFLVFSRLKPVSFAIFTTGFAASALEVILIIGFQVLYGFVYSSISIIITAFMLGLAVGSYYMNKHIKLKGIKTLARIELIVAAYSALLPLILMLLSLFSGHKAVYYLSKALFPLLAFLLAILVGMEFPLAARLSFKGLGVTTGTLYSSDFAGACIGALLVSALLLPLLGVTFVCLIISALNMLSFLLVWTRRFQKI